MEGASARAQFIFDSHGGCSFSIHVALLVRVWFCLLPTLLLMSCSVVALCCGFGCVNASHGSALLKSLILLFWLFMIFCSCRHCAIVLVVVVVDAIVVLAAFVVVAICCGACVLD